MKHQMKISDEAAHQVTNDATFVTLAKNAAPDGIQRAHP